MNVRSQARAVLAIIFFMFARPAGLHAAPPDLTAAGVIPTIDRAATYNLGATGLRGWIYISGGNVGADGLMTNESRQILVTVAQAPANAVLAVDDVILGAQGGSSGTVPLFTSDCRKAFGVAIGEAEKTGVGSLRVKRWRAGTIADVNIPMVIMGNYTDSAPYSCPKSALILANARTKLVGQLLAGENLLTPDYAGAITGLALLAGVAPTDPNYAAVQSHLQTFAHGLATTGPRREGLDIWKWSYAALFLSEYYLSTGDSSVLSGINQFAVALAQGQSMYGTFGHSPAVVRPDGSGRRSVIGYGPVNSAGLPANIAIVMCKKALLAAGQALDPEIDPAILRGSNFFAWYVNKGQIPYGEHAPGPDGHASNGKDASAAVLFGLQAGRTAETEYFTRMTIAGFTGREYGHTGQGLSYLWGALGANMGGALATAEYLKGVRWHLDLERRTDGSFVYDGAEQYGAGTTAGGTYLGGSSYYGLNPTASYILTYGLPLERLYITGKNANPANTLDAAKVSSAMTAATFKLDCAGLTTTQLITSLSEYDPVVRHYAAIELAKRSLTTGETNTLVAMVTGADTNGRMGACQTLGIRQNVTALPSIVGRLSDADIWVRAAAATALRSYSSTASSGHLNSMLTAFAANATDPKVIDWSDPVQMSNGTLSLVLFGNGVPDGNDANDVANYTINAPKSLFYPAIKAGFKQPDSYPRTGVGSFSYSRLPIADVQALMPNLFDLVKYECEADRMWSASPRAAGIATLAKYRIKEAMPLALALMEVPTDWGWGADEYLAAALNALAVYGDAARWTLPKLKECLQTWDPASSQYPALINTIASIDAAITAPVLVPGLAVANPQVVSTTGPKAITLTGTSPRTSSVAFTNLTSPAHGTLTGTAPNLTYTPAPGYTGPDRFTFQTVDDLTTSDPGTVSIIVGTAGTGLKGEYYDNADFTNLKLSRTDAQVNFDWGSGSPDASMGMDTFSVHWSGLLLVPETGTYQFSTLNSDGVRLYLNGVLMIDDFVDHATRWKDGSSITLTAGQWVEVDLFYYENTGSAVAKLKWTGPSFAGVNGALIAKEWLYDGTGFNYSVPFAHPQNVTAVQNTPQPITLTGSRGTLTYSIVTQPAHGVLTGTAPNLTYHADASFNGSDSFNFLVNNGVCNSSPATVSIGIGGGPLVAYTWLNAASGNWSGAGNWTPGAPAATGNAAYSLNFTPSGTYTATQDLNNGFLLNQLNLAGEVSLAGSNRLNFVANGAVLPQFNQNSSSTVNVANPIDFIATTIFGGTLGGRVNLQGLLSGSGGLTKNGSGNLQISFGANTYSGGTVINEGSLSFITGDGSTVPFLGPGPVTINRNGTLVLDRNDLSNSFVLNGGTVAGDNGFGSTLSGSVTLSNISTVDLSDTGGLHLTGNISGTGGFKTVGTTNWRLSGTNTYTGPTMVEAGGLIYSQAAAVAPGALSISTGAKVTLNYSGTRHISSLSLGSTNQPAGSYGSTASAATNKNDTYFAGTGSVTLLPATTTTLSMTGGSSPSELATPLTFTASVSGSSPAGNVAFYAGTTLLGTRTLNGAFQASLTTSSLAVGSHTITAQYEGNSANAASTSAGFVIQITTVFPLPPTNLLAVGGSQTIALSWTLSSGATSYRVWRAVSSGGPYTVIANPGSASFSDSGLVNGTAYYYVVSAVNGSGEGGKSSEASAVPVNPNSTTTLVSSPTSTAAYGTAVTFTATVAVSGGSATGTVTFKDGSTVLGIRALSAGTASLTTSTLAVANHVITANYSGDSSFSGSVSPQASYSVTPKPLSVTGVTASDKVYDKTATAALSAGSISGSLVGGESVTLIPGTGTFASATVGPWAVTATGFSLGGPNAGNYLISSQPTVPNASITPRAVELTGTRAYDGTVAAGSLTIANSLDAENLSLAGSAYLAGKDAGQQAVITGTAAPKRVGSAKGNTGASAASTINVTMGTVPVAGNSLVAVIATRGTTSNIVSSITQAGLPNGAWVRAAEAHNASMTTEIWYAPNVPSGTGAAVVINQGSFLSAAVVMEYSGILTAAPIDQIASSTGTSTTAVTGTIAATSQANELWIGAIGFAHSTRTLATLLNSFGSIDNAVTTNGSAANNARVYALERIVSVAGAASSGGTISASTQWAGALATFKATASTLALTGSAAANYTLTGAAGSVTVTPKALSISAPTIAAKVYDATPVTGAVTLGTLSGGIGAETLVATATGVFPSANVGTYPNATVTYHLTNGTNGGLASNYSLPNDTATGGTITARALTLTAQPNTKTYDGAMTAAAVPTASGLQGSDTVSALTEIYDNKHFGAGKTLTVNAYTINDGNGGNNYNVALLPNTAGVIEKRSATLTAVSATKAYDGNLTAPGVPTLNPALAPGDTTTVFSQSFQTPDVGSGKLIVPSITINDGNGGANYAVTLINSNTGSINKATASVTLGGLTPTYDGNPKPVTVTTNPTPLAYDVTYDGSSTAPVNAGTYAILAILSDANYMGSAAGSLVIAKAWQTITFGALTTVPDSAAPFALDATASSGLPVSYSSSNAAVATVLGNTVTIVGLGSTMITASQPGDTNYNAATSLAQTLTVIRANPLALAGGPYKVLLNQSLAVDGTASFPSGEATITTYSWDLNNDGTFGDANGAMPAAISYAALTTTWGMGQGANTIKLKVTDSAGKTATASATVNLVLALTWDANNTASGQTNGAGAWLGNNQWWDGSTNLNWVAGSDAVFGGMATAGGAVSLASPTTVGLLTLNAFTGTYTLGTAGQALTLGGGLSNYSTAGAASLLSPVVLSAAQTWTNNSSGQLKTSNGLNNAGHLLTFTGTGNFDLSAATNVIAGAGGLTMNGSGRLVLGASGTVPVHNYSGPTTLGGGVTMIASGNLGTGNLTLNAGVIETYGATNFTRTLGAGVGEMQILGGTSGFSLNTATAASVIVNNSAAYEVVWGSTYFSPSALVLQASSAQSGAALTMSNKLDLNGATRTVQVSAATATLSGVIRSSTGTAGLIKTGGGTLILGAANTFNGTTTISGGMLQIGNNSAGTLGNGTYNSDISIASGATLRIYSTADQVLGGAISGGGGVVKSYGGSLTLSGSNSYSGKTSLTPVTTAGGGTLSVASFNSVVTDAALGTVHSTTSSLGSPITVANGTIDLGSTGAQASATLKYTGSGETTDRVVNFQFNGTGATKTLDASGGGVLKFTSPFTANAVATNDITLTGSSSGEIVGGLPFAFRNLTKSGNGTWTLGGTVLHTGTHTIAAGTLALGANDVLPATTPISIGNAVLKAGTFSDTVGTLDVTSAATINLASGGALAFADSSAIDWTGGTLNITGTFVPGVSLRFGTSNTGLSAAQLARISSPGFGPFFLNANGYLIVDNVEPTLASTAIVDDQGGVPVAVNTLVTYTVTFSEDMDASTVSAADFGNAGTSNISIGSVTETSPGVFTAQVAPVSVGTLRLRVNAGAVLKDVAGNSLNTLSSIVDDTTISVLMAYANWSGGGAFDADANNDGVENGVAWVLGAANLSADASGLLPTLDMTSDVNYVIYTFRRRALANADPSASIAVQYSSDLAGWTTAQHDGTNIIITPTADVYGAGIDKVVVKIRRSLAPAGNLFCRLKVTYLP